MKNDSTKVNIQPEISILSVLKSLNYKMHYALSEFVDNSIDSYIKNKQRLHDLNDYYQLTVRVEVNADDSVITVSDNAGGIHGRDMDRAFRTAVAPPDTSGLSEFGMGMKAAACWFANTWEVRSKSVDEIVERTVRFDVNRIVENRITELDVKFDYDRAGHYTVVKLDGLHQKIPKTRSIGKIKEHLTSIYRDFIRTGELRLIYNGEDLDYKPQKILCAPYYNYKNRPVGEEILWKKKIDFDLSSSMSVRGFIGILATGSQANAGLTLFRRRRVILGTSEDSYKPESIFGKGNSFASQRLFGELHLVGFNVTHTKDGFREDENMEVFVDTLKEELEYGNNSYLSQVQNYRKTPSVRTQSKRFGKVLQETVEDVKDRNITTTVEEIIQSPLHEDSFENLVEIQEKNYEELTVRFGKQTWVICIELSYENSYDDLIELGDSFIRGSNVSQESVRKIGIRIAMKHPFMIEHAVFKKDGLEGLIKLVAAIGLAEVAAKKSGIKFANTFRRNINQLLKESLL